MYIVEENLLYFISFKYTYMGLIKIYLYIIYWGSMSLAININTVSNLVAGLYVGFFL